MEELQDAIEDVQYMNAMHDDTPKPTKEWRKPSTEELQKYMTSLLQKIQERMKRRKFVREVWDFTWCVPQKIVITDTSNCNSF